MNEMKSRNQNPTPFTGSHTQHTQGEALSDTGAHSRGSARPFSHAQEHAHLPSSRAQMGRTRTSFGLFPPGILPSTPDSPDPLILLRQHVLQAKSLAHVLFDNAQTGDDAREDVVQTSAPDLATREPHQRTQHLWRNPVDQMIATQRGGDSLPVEQTEVPHGLAGHKRGAEGHDMLNMVDEEGWSLPTEITSAQLDELTRIEIASSLVAMFEQPDGDRLVQAALEMLIQLNHTSRELIEGNVLHDAPELLAFPLTFPAENVVLLLRLYLKYSAAAEQGDHSEHTGLMHLHCSCHVCGTQWPLDEARRWRWFESFMLGAGCPTCTSDWR